MTLRSALAEAGRLDDYQFSMHIYRTDVSAHCSSTLVDHSELPLICLQRVLYMMYRPRTMPPIPSCMMLVCEFK
jgi:hypothetical protein